MASEQTVIAIAGAVSTVLPSIVGLLKAVFVQQNPGAPPPTDSDILSGFATACLQSIGVDDEWLAAHPKAHP